MDVLPFTLPLLLSRPFPLLSRNEKYGLFFAVYTIESGFPRQTLKFPPKTNHRGFVIPDFYRYVRKGRRITEAPGLYPFPPVGFSLLSLPFRPFSIVPSYPDRLTLTKPPPLSPPPCPRQSRLT